MNIRIPILAVIPFAFTATTASLSAQTTGSRAGAAASAAIPADALKQIGAANKAWLPALKRGDAATVAEPYADAGIFVTATGETARGRAGIEQLMKERFARARFVGGSLMQDGVVLAGSLIYEWGHATMRVARPGQPEAESRGQYLTVWKKDASGRWRIIRNLSM